MNKDSILEKLKKIKVKENSLKFEVGERQKLLSKTINEKRELEEKLKALNHRDLDCEIKITEHAIMRYLERVVGMDLDGLKEMIVNEYTLSQIKIFGNGKYKQEGYTLTVKDGAIVTIY